MELWITIVIVAQLFHALVSLFDKYIVSHSTLPNPVVYAFYVNLLSSVSIIILLIGEFINPFIRIFEVTLPMLSELTIPTGKLVILSLIFGFVTLQALIAFYKALRQADASDVAPMVTAVASIVSLILSHYLFDVAFTRNTFVAFALLVVGTLLISRLRCSFRVVRLSITAGILFAVHSVLLKVIFNDFSFSDGFFWTRMAGVIAALSLLSLRGVRYRVFSQGTEGSTKTGLWIIGNKVVASVASLLTLTAINLGNVAVVNALGGLQFIFLLLFGTFLGHKTPREIGENVSHRDVVHKAIPILCVAVGLVLLFL